LGFNGTISNTNMPHRAFEKYVAVKEVK